MAVKWSTPGFGFSEIDNSVQATTTTADGVGAIVIAANQGYVNQRVLTTSRKEFHEKFGDQETSEDYGHFAADQYLPVSPQLYAVRATMGDEQYGFIQFTYDDAAAKDCKIDELQQTFEYVDNDGNTQIKLLKPMTGKGIQYADVSAENWQTFTAKNAGTKVTEELFTNTAFCLVDNGYAATIQDLQYDQDPAITIFRDDGQVFSGDSSKSVITSAQGKYYNIVNTAESQIKLFLNADALKNNSTTSAYVFSSEADYNAVKNSITGAYVVRTDNEKNSTYSAYPYEFYVPNSLTMNDDEAGTSVSFFANSANEWKDTDFNVQVGASTISAATADIASIPEQYITSAEILASANVVPCQLFSWNDNENTNKMIVDIDCFKAATNVSGVQYREITGALYNQSLVTVSSTKTSADIYVNDTAFTALAPADQAYYGKIAENGYVITDTSAMNYAHLKELAYNNYGKDVADINTSAYRILGILDANTLTIDEKILFADNPNDTDGKKDSVYVSKYIFNTYVDEDEGVDGKRVIKAAYISRKPQAINMPWQYDETSDTVNKLVAYPSSDVMNDTTGIYKDGYTKTILTLDEPGNGDIERYDSKQNNQLVIASVGPGEYGNNIGISVITPAVAGNMALENEAAAFNWKYNYDDEDVVDKDWQAHPTYKENPLNLTWKKLYKINVYVKTKNQQASVWGSGLDALVKEPVESWLVSNDPTAKDGNGNTFYAPYVINGNSKYIYVSLSSVTNSKTVAGTYAMPKQTYSIYQLQGGKNSTKNNIKEKTAALELYRDRARCKFDIIFNVDPIETFQSRQKYAAMQNRIAEIAIDRGIDIGFIQATSKAARTGYKALSEGKLFSFQNGSYVACEAGYDRYYDSYTSNWVYLPKSVAMAVAHARCWVSGKPWMAPAGIKRGTIDYTNGQLLKLSDTEIGQLYDANINCSRTCASYGEVIWCQKTALKKTSALNRINVRGLVNYIEKYLEQMLIPYLYQQNTTTTRSSMRSTVDSFLSGIMADEGIISKSVTVTPDPSDSHLVYVNITIVPAETIEFIQITTTINKQNNTITSTTSD